MLGITRWIGTSCVIVAATCRSFNLHEFDLCFSILGASIWGYVAIVNNDKPLLTINGFILAVLTYGVLK